MQGPPDVGERIIVHGMTQYEAIVSSISWDSNVFDWIIELDWKEFGTSRVKLHDEHRVWYRYQSSN